MEEDKDNRSRGPDEKPGDGERATEPASAGSEAEQGAAALSRTPSELAGAPAPADEAEVPQTSESEPAPSSESQEQPLTEPEHKAASGGRVRDYGPYLRTAAVSAAVALFALAFFAAGFWINDVLGEDEGSGGGETPANVADDPAWGPEDALVVVEEFSDFECPYCGEFAQNTMPQIRQAFENKVRFVYRDFPLSQIHESAQKAAEAAQCAHEQGLFWEFHDAMFANQGALDVPSLKVLAENAGADVEEFNACLDSGKNAWEVLLDVKDGNEAGVSGTPAFLINGLLLPGVRPYEQFAAILEAALANAGG